LTRSNDNQKPIYNQEKESTLKNNLVLFQNQEYEDEYDNNDPLLIEKFKNSLQMFSIHRNLVWKEQACLNKYSML
jgi:hypothetical protein